MDEAAVVGSELELLDDKLGPLVEQMMARDDEQEMAVLLRRIEELLASAP